MSEFELPFDPIHIVLQGLLRGVGVFFEILSMFPWWMHLLIVALVALRLSESLSPIVRWCRRL